MSSSTVQLPEDTLLDLAQYLDVTDLISLLSTCRVIRQIQLQKSLWLDCLIRIREVERHPHPLSNVEDLSTLSLHRLQRTAQRAGRLMKNLRSNNPRPTRIHHFSVQPRCGFFCLTGTRFIVTHDEGIASCWDVFNGERVAHLEIPDLFVRGIPCMDEAGKALICGSIGGDSRVDRLVAICIDYRAGARVSISHVVSPAVNEQFAGIFYITPQVAGFSGRGYIITWSMNPNAKVTKQTDEVPRTPNLSCLPLEQNIYIFSQGSIATDASVQCLPLFPRRHPQSGNIDATPNTIVIPTRYSFASNQKQLRRISIGVMTMTSHVPRVCPPRYGVFAVTCRSLQWDGSPVSVVHFWQGETAERGTVLNTGEAYYYEQRDHIRLWAVGHSGTYVLLLVDGVSSNERDGYLGLLHFSSTPNPHTTFRKLDIRDAFALASVSQIALDDSLGTVFLVDKEGSMTIISYA
ncbi:hypothetical protein C8F04DRAFT_1067998 [Mycena alexandri]|uniref:F-box domain-containing protein n=1 Tax=Mycena alexandri TaxID=1745969 RepID=A0AAD6XAG8_9AGAR|nr:hypothetical protein C8F04DRAFT_1067998 [Mycena alexandri]